MLFALVGTRRVYKRALERMEAELETATGDELRKHFAQLSQDYHRLEMRRLKKAKDEADNALKQRWIDHRIAMGQAKAVPATQPQAPAPALAFAKSSTHLPTEVLQDEATDLPDEKPWQASLRQEQQPEPEPPGQEASAETTHTEARPDAGAFMERMWQDYNQRHDEAHRYLRHLAHSRAGPRAIAW